MILGITDQKIAVWQQTHAMWSSELPISDFIAIAIEARFPALPHDGFHQSGFKIDPTNGMILRIRDVQRLAGIDGNSLWTFERRLPGVRSIASKPFLPSSSDVIDPP